MATMVAAAKAFCMKSYSSTELPDSLHFVGMCVAVAVAMLVALHILVARHHEDTALYAHHVDLGSVEAREHRAGDHLIHGAERRLPASEIEHAIERAEQRIALMGTEQDRDPELHLQRFHQGHHGVLVMRIEADQGLVQQ